MANNEHVTLKVTQADVTEILCALDLVGEDIANDSEHHKVIKKLIDKINRQWSMQQPV